MKLQPLDQNHALDIISSLFTFVVVSVGYIANYYMWLTNRIISGVLRS